MGKQLSGKYELLYSGLRKLGSIAIAFSGGVDSVYLLHAAREALGENVLALTINTSYIPDWEIEEARVMAENLGVRHEILDVEVPGQIMNNPPDRCYLCKTFLFTLLKEFASEKGYKYLADGSNADDTREHRPGMKALLELGIISPLLEAGFTKTDIRTASKEAGLQTWLKPAYACMLTRIPYDTKVDNELLAKIEAAETYLIGLGIKAVRVRVHGDLARIETDPLYIEKIFKEKLHDDISIKLKELGFSFVTLDLQGYRTGGIEVK